MKTESQTSSAAVANSNATTTTTTTYRSGVAARRAGVPVETLRVWERRYGVVNPSLSSHGQRLYSAVDVRRLTLIKQLVDMGHPIGVVARLRTEQLVELHVAEMDAAQIVAPERARLSTVAADFHEGDEIRIALVGTSLSARWVDTSTASSALKIVAQCMLTDAAATATATTSVLQDCHADIAIIELATLNDETIETVSNIKVISGALQIIVMYRYAPSAVIRRLRVMGYEVARGPSDLVEIELLCRALMKLPRVRPKVFPRFLLTDEPHTPIFDEAALMKLATASTTVDCECPRHLVELVISLNGFERYSADCANRDEADAALHEDLKNTAAAARSLIEDALMRVAIAEGLPVPTIAAKR